jgi:two-component system, chemotaxis family, protein-glutamate methylesterase/glutaminase
VNPFVSPNRKIIVIGASAGGITALRDVVRGLSPELPAAVFVVCHTSPNGSGELASVIGTATSIPVAFAKDGDAIQPGTVRVAAPDHHLILDENRMHLNRGPKHNRARPSIDVLFRSAAEAHGSRVIGVVLSGLLDDGAAGLLAIKRRGGTAIVQDPGDARFPDMPRNALAATHVDHCLPAVGMGSLLGDLASLGQKRDLKPDAPALGIEVRADAGSHVSMGDLGGPSAYSCPECGGVLWEIRDPDLLRFRCRVGHAFSREGRRVEHDHLKEDSLWAAVRALRESASYERRLAERFRHQSLREAAEEAERKATVDDGHADRLFELVTAGPTPAPGLESSTG